MLYLTSSQPEPAEQRLLSLCLISFCGCRLQVQLCYFPCSYKQEAGEHLHGIMLSWLHFGASWWREGSFMPPHRHGTKSRACSWWSWKVVPTLPYSAAEIRCCGLGGITLFWILDFTVLVVSLDNHPHGWLSFGVFAKIQMSAQQSASLTGKRILAKGTIGLTQEKISFIFKATSHSSCLKLFVLRVGDDSLQCADIQS